MTSPTPSTKRDLRSVDQIGYESYRMLLDLIWNAGGLHEDHYKLKNQVDAYILTLLDQYARAVCEEAIGVEEELGPRPPALDGSAWEEFTTKEHRNELRAEQRTKLNELVGKGGE